MCAGHSHHNFTDLRRVQGVKQSKVSGVYLQKVLCFFRQIEAVKNREFGLIGGEMK